MKTFAKMLAAGSLGLFGMVGAAQAALPYGYTSNAYGIAAGGCYTPATLNGYGSTYRPTSYGHSAYDDRFRTLPSAHRNTSYDRWDDDCNYGSSSRLSSKYDHHNSRFDRTPVFEPWRPANTSHRPDRWNW